MHRHQRDGIALGHLHQDSLQQLQHRGWNGNGCVLAVLQIQGEAGLPQTMAGTEAGEIAQACSCRLSRLSSGDHGLHGAGESDGHRQQGEKPPEQ